MSESEEIGDFRQRVALQDTKLRSAMEAPSSSSSDNSREGSIAKPRRHQKIPQFNDSDDEEMDDSIEDAESPDSDSSMITVIKVDPASDVEDSGGRSLSKGKQVSRSSSKRHLDVPDVDTSEAFMAGPNRDYSSRYKRQRSLETAAEDDDSASDQEEELDGRRSRLGHRRDDFSAFDDDSSDDEDTRMDRS